MMKIGEKTKWMALVMIVSFAWMSGCSDTSGPATGDSPLGDLDPGTGRITMKTLEVEAPDGQRVRLALEGGDIELMDDGMTIVMNVVLRNLGGVPVGAPLIVWVGDFTPESVMTEGHDFVAPGLPGEPPVTGFDYSGMIGDDGLLTPGEASEPKQWAFIHPGQGPFSFGGWLEGGFGPPPGELGGFCFLDHNLDGVRQPEDPPFAGLGVQVRGPDGREWSTFTGQDGRYAVPTEAPGLYEIRITPPPTFAPVDLIFSTPHPLYVTLTPGPDGFPLSYLDADFGLNLFNALHPPVLFSDVPADSLHFAPWTLLEAHVEEDRFLALGVGYSGCGPHHPFTLYAVSGFMESLPPQINLVLVHEVDEACDAAWQQGLVYDLNPLRRRFLDAYGPGVLIMNLIEFDGETTQLELHVEVMPHD